jgi:hypothetical protein
MTWVRHEMRKVFWYGNLKEINNLENLGRGEKILLKWIFMKLDLKVWTKLI